MTTLFALLEPMRPIALIGTSATSPDDPGLAAVMRALSDAGVPSYMLGGVAATLEDLHGDFRQLYGLTGEFLCLIRPDDHIGLIQRRLDPEGVAAYLRLLSPTPD